jgi:2-dehydropantoate 2-reductase
MDNKKQDIGVVGIGAIGSVISFELQKNNPLNALHYYGRTPKKSIRLLKGKTRHEVPIVLRTSPFKADHLDWLIVCIKEHQFPGAVEMLSTLIGPQTKIAVIRNGLRLKNPFLKFTDENKILECSIDCPTQPTEDGYYESFKNPVLTVPSGKLANQFEQLFKNSETEILQVADFKTQCWKKVCESSALGSILCLCGETCWVFEDDKLISLYINLLKEGLNVADADGAKIETDFTDKMLAKLRSYPKTKGSSMLTDRINGNLIELGAKNRIITEIGELYKINTPLNELMVQLLSKINNLPDKH